MDIDKYPISKGQRTLLITAALIVIANYCTLGLAQFQNGAVGTIFEDLQIIIFAISYSYILFSLRLYFKFYELKRLTNLTLVIIIGELIGSALDIFKSNLLPEFLTVAVNVLTFILIFIWAYYLTRLDKSLHRERTSLYRHGYAIFITFFFALVIIFNVSYQGNLTLFNSHQFLFAIPYLFLIDFALKLYNSTRTQETAST